LADIEEPEQEDDGANQQDLVDQLLAEFGL